MKKYASIAVLVLLGVFIIQSGPLFGVKLTISSFFNETFGRDSTSVEELKKRVEILESENEDLKAQILNEDSNILKSIKVYSSYPFNTRGEIVIAAGENFGIEAGDTVVDAGNILVGQVRSVFKSSSVVTTIFDPSWEMAIRIGGTEIDALMKGGNELKLSLIAQDALIEEGDTVTSADKNFPYGLELGFIKRIENTDGDVFQEAVLEPTVNLKNLRDVAIYR